MKFQSKPYSGILHLLDLILKTFISYPTLLVRFYGRKLAPHLRQKILSLKKVKGNHQPKLKLNPIYREDAIIAQHYHYIPRPINHLRLQQSILGKLPPHLLNGISGGEIPHIPIIQMVIYRYKLHTMQDLYLTYLNYP